MPKILHIEALPDNKNRAALLWGPLVLAGDLGPERRGGPVDPVPSLVTAEKSLGEWLQPVPGHLGVFRSVGVGRKPDGESNEVELRFRYDARSLR